MSRIDGGSNYLSQSEMSAHFGLGSNSRIDELTVQWTNGMITSLQNVDANQILTISPDPSDCVLGDLLYTHLAYDAEATFYAEAGVEYKVRVFSYDLAPGGIGPYQVRLDAVSLSAGATSELVRGLVVMSKLPPV